MGVSLEKNTLAHFNATDLGHPVYKWTKNISQGKVGLNILKDVKVFQQMTWKYFLLEVNLKRVEYNKLVLIH